MKTAKAPNAKVARPVKGKGGIWPWLFVAPLLSGVIVFYYYPIIKNFYLAFARSDAFGGSAKWVGLENYTDLFNRPDLASATINTIIYTLAVVASIIISVLIAALIELPGLRGVRFYRTVFFMPYLAMPIAVSQVWKIIFNGNFGLFNQMLKGLGVSNPPYWLSTPGFALAVVIFYGIWSSIGFNVIILSAGLKSIPHELYEAAAIDGAGRVKQFTAITIPLLTPSIFLLAIVTTIGGLQLFDSLFAIVGTANPAMKDTRSLVYLFYNTAFENNDKGGAAAIAVIILVMVALVTLFQFVMQKKWVRYV